MRKTRDDGLDLESVSKKSKASLEVWWKWKVGELKREGRLREDGSIVPRPARRLTPRDVRHAFPHISGEEARSIASLLASSWTDGIL